MERHDIELKEREDQMIEVTAELSEVSKFTLTMQFTYQKKDYEAYCYYEPHGQGIHQVNVYAMHEELEITDNLEEIAEQYFREQYKVTPKNIFW